jgi:hypothetical protein
MIMRNRDNLQQQLINNYMNKTVKRNKIMMTGKINKKYIKGN